MALSVAGMNSVPRKEAPTMDRTKAAMMPIRTIFLWASAWRSQPS